LSGLVFKSLPWLEGLIASSVPVKAELIFRVLFPGLISGILISGPFGFNWPELKIFVSFESLHFLWLGCGGGEKIAQRTSYNLNSNPTCPEQVNAHRTSFLE
jgi:hypothetical protein